MSRVVIVGLLAGAGGFALGLWVADLYAKNKIQTTVDAGLAKVGLGGGTVQSIVDTTVLPDLY